MQQSLKCNQCYRQFNSQHLPKSLPCGHNICQVCLQDISQSQFNVIFCQYCQKTMPKQQSQLPFCQNVPLQLQTNRFKSISPPKLQKQELETLLDDKPLQFSTMPSTPYLSEICPTHQVIMDIICTTDKKKICPHCALFGDHKKHSFKRVDDFQQQLLDKYELFHEIQVEMKQGKANQQEEDLFRQISNRINARKKQLIQSVNKTVENSFELVISLQKKVLQEIDTYYDGLSENIFNDKIANDWKQSKSKLKVWQKRCQVNIQKLQKSESIEEKIDLYFNEPLQIVSEGYIYLERATETYQKLHNAVNTCINVSLNAKGLNSAIQDAFKLKIPDLTCLDKSVSQNKNQDSSSQNPFLDFTSSQIGLNGASLIHNNLSIQDQICSLTNSVKIIDQGSSKIISDKLIASQKSPNNKRLKKQPLNQFRRATVGSPKAINLKDTKVSQLSGIKSTKKLTKTVLIKPAFQPQLKDCDLKQPDRRLADFMKNTLTDFLDLSDCHLPSQKVTEYVSKARKHHKIKGLKLSENYLDCAGFEKMLDNLKGVTNINLANNQITQSIFECLLKNKQKIDMLRVLNLSHNPISLQKKGRSKLEELKKTGIIINI